MFCTQQANACTQKANAIFWKISQVSCQLWDFQRRTYMPILPFLMEGIQSTMQKMSLVNQKTWIHSMIND